MTAAAQPDPYLPQPATVTRKEQITALEALFEVRLDSGAGVADSSSRVASNSSSPGWGSQTMTMSGA